MSSPKSVDFGSLKTSIPSTIVRCQAPDTFVTRLDIQANQWTGGGWATPYISGFRLYCSNDSPVQELNWNAKPVNGSVFTNVDGAVVKQGINDLIVSHGEYINLVGYGPSTMIGNLKDVKLWQQAAVKDFEKCLLVGIECTHASWIDGCRMHFSCASDASPTGTPASGSEVGSVSTSGGFAVGTFFAGAGAGLVIAAAALAVLVFVRGRQMAAAAAQAEPSPAEMQPSLAPQAPQVVAADPYAAVFSNNNANNNSTTGSDAWLAPPKP